MKYLVFALAFFLYTQVSMAQGDKKAPKFDMNNLGQVYGKILDKTSKKPLEGVSIFFMGKTSDHRKDTIYAGSFTSRNGDFRMEGLPYRGVFKLKVSALGYQEHSQQVTFKMPQQQGKSMEEMMANIGNLVMDLGNVSLEKDPQILQDVQVENNKSSVNFQIDRKTFDVSKNINTSAGSALDVMRNIPSIQVDVNGTVLLRNSSPQIFVDGRPTDLTLEQIPAGDIEKVELITNPSAKFQAKTSSGIINIVMKKNKAKGFLAMMSAYITRDAKMGGSLISSLRTEKISYSLALFAFQRRSIYETELTRHASTPSVPAAIYQQGKGTWDGSFMFARPAIDISISNRATLSLNGMVGRGRFNSDDDTWTKNTDSFNAKTYSSRIGVSQGEMLFTRGQLLFKQQFPQEGHELSTAFDFRTRESKNPSITDIKTLDTYEGKMISDYYLNQQPKLNTTSYEFTLDYARPINDHSKIEGGLLYEFEQVNSTADILYQYPPASSYTLNASESNTYKINEHEYAAYLSYGTKLASGHNLQLGLRAEGTQFQNGLINDTTRYSKVFPISLFPSLNYAFTLGEQEFQLNYTRKIDRPDFFQLAPYADRRDNLNIILGNPNLDPQFVHLVELNHSLSWSKYKILSTLYYKRTDGLITPYQKQQVLNGVNTYLTTYINANSLDLAGFEMTSTLNLKPWWEIIPNINLYYGELKAGSALTGTTFSSTAYMAKLNQNFKLPKDYSIQLTGLYQSRSVVPPNSSSGEQQRGPRILQQNSTAAQGDIDGYYYVDFAIKKDLLIHKMKLGSLTFAMNDIFNSRKYLMTTNTSAYTQTNYKLRDGQYFTLTLQFRLGKIDAAMIKNKPKNTEGGSTEF